MTEKRQKKDKAELFEYYWRLLSPGLAQPTPEYKFATAIKYTDARGKERQRQYKFDYCFVNERIAVEVDGGQYAPGGGRHMTDRDREKQNCAALLGWVIFHFSPTMLKNNPVHCIEQVTMAMRGR